MLHPTKHPLALLTQFSPRPSSLRLCFALLFWLLSGFPTGGLPPGLPLAVPAAYAADLSYIYDDAGRLIAVVDPSAGEIAIYAYDEVGNLLSVSRQSSALVSLLTFTPKSGPVGTTVTLSGTAFSLTASQNTVTFNGVAAAVTAATATQLVTTVPAGATTGPLTVTTPTGSATSSAVFTVTAPGAAAGAPTITDFTPTSGTPGTPVTITGTNFDSLLANNKVAFNFTRATVSSFTTTTIATTVPAGAGSGRISVVTPYGKAVSNADFFIPPSPYTAADVGFTGRIAFGESKTVTLSTANKIALLLFDGTAGQRVSALLSNSTIPGCWTRLAILKPDGTQLAYADTCSSSVFLEPQTLPVTGTYTLLLDPPGASTGQATVTLYNVVDSTGSITPNGPAVNVTIPTPGQRALLSFSGTAGDRVSALLSNSPFRGAGHGSQFLSPMGLSWHMPIPVSAQCPWGRRPCP